MLTTREIRQMYNFEPANTEPYQHRPPIRYKSTGSYRVSGQAPPPWNYTPHSTRAAPVLRQSTAEAPRRHTTAGASRRPRTFCSSPLTGPALTPNGNAVKFEDTGKRGENELATRPRYRPSRISSQPNISTAYNVPTLQPPLRPEQVNRPPRPLSSVPTTPTIVQTPPALPPPIPRPMKPTRRRSFLLSWYHRESQIVAESSAEDIQPHSPDFQIVTLLESDENDFNASPSSSNCSSHEGVPSSVSGEHTSRLGPPKISFSDDNKLDNVGEGDTAKRSRSFIRQSIKPRRRKTTSGMDSLDRVKRFSSLPFLDVNVATLPVNASSASVGTMDVKLDDGFNEERKNTRRGFGESVRRAWKSINTWK